MYYSYACIAASIFSHLKADIQDFIDFSFVLNLTFSTGEVPFYRKIFHSSQSEYLQSYKIYIWVHFFCNLFWFHTKWPVAKLQDTHLNEARCNCKCALVRWPCFQVSHFHLLRASFGFLLYLQTLHQRHFSVIHLLEWNFNSNFLSLIKE